MIRIERLDDPRIRAYRNLRDRTLRGENVFVAEGRVVVERLLRSRCRAESLLTVEEHVAALAAMKPDCPIYVARPELLREIAGYPFHLGALAVGHRPENLRMEELLCGSMDSASCIVVCPAVTKPENLGLIFRSVAAFGLTGLVLGRRTCDPLSRRCVRVSMGASLDVPYVRTDDPWIELPRLRDPWRFERVATVLDPSAEQLDQFTPAARTALVFGNEFDGLEPDWLAECDRRVTIPMRPTVDSLNLGVAAGIFLHHWAAGFGSP